MLEQHAANALLKSPVHESCHLRERWEQKSGCWMPCQGSVQAPVSSRKAQSPEFWFSHELSIVFHAHYEHTQTHTHAHSMKIASSISWACDSCQLDHTLWVVQGHRQNHQSKDPAVLECIQPPFPLWELQFILATVFYSGVSLSLVSGNCLVIHRVENDSICNYNCNYIYECLCTHTDSSTDRHPDWWAEFSALHSEQKLMVLLM